MNTIVKAATAVKQYLDQSAREQALIAAELVLPSCPENRTLAAICYATQLAITLEWLVKSRRAYKAGGWAGVGKQYLKSTIKSVAVGHVVRRSTCAILAVNIKAAEKAAEAAKANSDFVDMVDMNAIIKKAFSEVEFPNSSL